MTAEQWWNGALDALAQIAEAVFSMGWWAVLLSAIIVSVGWSLTFNYDHYRGRK